MSLSQKHPNLVIVPWYNIEEWKFVFKLVYSNDKLEQAKALEILNIWKIRTPILSAGIEGTLIILDSLLLNSEDVPEDRLQHLYSVALVRFLNLCAAHNEKQGTFYKTAVKNDLPKWLINLRHDIAHSHKLPSKSMLEMGLKFGLDWLKEKYWEPQSSKIEDYVIEEQTESEFLEKILKAYINLKTSNFKNIDLTSNRAGFLQEVTDIIYKKFHRSRIEVNEMVDILEEMLRGSFESDRNKNIGKTVADILVNENCLLCPVFEVDDQSSGEEKIARTFRDNWLNLLKILHENKLLFHVVNRLFNATGDMCLSEPCKKMASLWLCELFFSFLILKLIKDHIDAMMLENPGLDAENAKNLLKAKLGDKPCFQEYMQLDCIKHIYLEEAKKFESQVVHLPNEYTLNYLEIILKYNDRSDTFISDTINLVKYKIGLINANKHNFSHNLEEGIHTLEKLTANLSFDDGEQENADEDRDLNEENNFKFENGEDVGMVDLSDYLGKTGSDGTRRWKVIKDTSKFEGCALGVFPDHSVNESPLVKFYKPQIS